MVKGIIFDLDGTILDTIGDIRSALNKTLGSSFTDVETKAFVGNGLKNSIRHALAKLGRPEDNVDELFISLKEFYKADPVRYTTAFPGVQNFLKLLNSKNIAVAVFSNKEQELAEKVVTLSLPEIKFEMIIGRNGGYPSKPDPEAVLAFAKHIGVSKDEIFYIGDSEVDYTCAKNAEVRSAILTWGTRTKEFLVEQGVESACLVSNMTEAGELAGVI